MCVYDRVREIERERTHLLGIWDRTISPSVRRERERQKERGSECERDMAHIKYTN